MKKELRYFNIGYSYGGNQEWFCDPMMKLGGCGAETAIEASIYMSLYKGKKLYPFNIDKLSRKDYRQFGKIMRPYLAPRMSGIDRTEIFVEGFSQYIKDQGESGIIMHEVQGDTPYEEAKAALVAAIDSDLPIAMLTLMHQDKKYHDFEWHWYTIAGYREDEDGFFVKTVTYSEYLWLNFQELWDTGRERKGGFVTYELIDKEN